MQGGAHWRPELPSGSILFPLPGLTMSMLSSQSASVLPQRHYLRFLRNQVSPTPHSMLAGSPEKKERLARDPEQ